MTEFKDIKTNVIPLKEGEETELQDFIKRIQADSLKAEKRVKRLKLMMILFGVYVVTIIIAGLLSILHPQSAYITDKYLIACNMFSAGLCIYSLVSWYRHKMYKEKDGWFLFVVGIFGIVINFVPYFLD